MSTPALGRHARAAERYEQSLQLDDRQAEVFYKLAVARYRDGRSGAAIDPLRRALTLAPGFAEAQYLLGISLRDASRLDEALAALNAAARLSPGLLEAREARADVLQARGEVARAVDELDALAALEPDRAERAVAVGLGLRPGRPGRLGRGPRPGPRRRALPAVERGVRGAGGGLAARGRFRRHGGARQGAGRARSRRLARRCRRRDIYPARPRAAERAGDLEGAERHLRRAVERLPAPSEAFLHLAEVLERGQRWEEARDTLVQYATLESGHAGGCRGCAAHRHAVDADRRSARRVLLVREGDCRGRRVDHAAAAPGRGRVRPRRHRPRPRAGRAGAGARPVARRSAALAATLAFRSRACAGGRRPGGRPT